MVHAMTNTAPSKPQKLRLVPANSKRSRMAKAILKDEFGDAFDPVLELVRIAQSTDSDMVAAQALSQVCKYTYPQLKSVETKSTTVHEVVMSDGELLNRFRQYMEKYRYK